MPKRVAEDTPSGSLSRQDSGYGVKSRSGRVVKPKIFNDYDPLDDDNHSKDATDEHINATQSDDEDSRGTSSNDSFGPRGQRTASQPSRPSRRAISSFHTQSRPGGGGGGGGIFKAAAVEVLKQERRLMSTGDIARAAIARGLVVCTGKTPEATMASALYTDVKRKEEFSVFIRPSEGLFGLREWLDQGAPCVRNVVAAAGNGINDRRAPATMKRSSSQQHHASNQRYNTLQYSQHAAAAAVNAAAVPYQYHTNTNTNADDGDDDDDAVNEEEYNLISDGHQHSMDRLMELLDAAEEINKAARTMPTTMPAAAGADETTDGESDKENDKRDTKHAAVVVASPVHAACHPRNVNQNRSEGAEAAMDAARSQGSLPCELQSCADTVAEEAIRAAEAAVCRLTQRYGEGHPQVNRGYLTLARLYTFDLPSPSRKLAESAVEQAQENISRVQETAVLHSTATTVALSTCKTDEDDSSFTDIMQKLHDEATVDAVECQARLQSVHAALVNAVKPFQLKHLSAAAAVGKAATGAIETEHADSQGKISMEGEDAYCPAASLISPIQQTSTGGVSSGTAEMTPLMMVNTAGSAVQTAVVVAGPGV